jgi:hypothetical protein
MNDTIRGIDFTDIKTDALSEIRLDDGKLPSFAWPGGYQMYYLDESNCVLCPDCANKGGYTDEVVSYGINWEDHELYCDDCSQQIEASYE